MGKRKPGPRKADIPIPPDFREQVRECSACGWEFKTTPERRRLCSPCYRGTKGTHGGVC